MRAFHPEEQQYFCKIETPLGEMTATSYGQAISGLWFSGQKHYPKYLDQYIELDDLATFKELRLAMTRYFNGDLFEFEIAVEPKGTAFQKEVWRVLRDIKFGQIVTYSEIAKLVGVNSARAAANAISRNPISIIIPCHRVIGKDGSLTGYAGGLEKKAAMLEHESITLY